MLFLQVMNSQLTHGVNNAVVVCVTFTSEVTSLPVWLSVWGMYKLGICHTKPAISLK